MVLFDVNHTTRWADTGHIVREEDQWGSRLRLDKRRAGGARPQAALPATDTGAGQICAGERADVSPTKIDLHSATEPGSRRPPAGGPPTTKLGARGLAHSVHWSLSCTHGQVHQYRRLPCHANKSAVYLLSSQFWPIPSMSRGVITASQPSIQPDKVDWPICSWLRPLLDFGNIGQNWEDSKNRPLRAGVFGSPLPEWPHRLPTSASQRCVLVSGVAAALFSSAASSAALPSFADTRGSRTHSNGWPQPHPCDLMAVAARHGRPAGGGRRDIVSFRWIAHQGTSSPIGHRDVESMAMMGALGAGPASVCRGGTTP